MFYFRLKEVLFYFPEETYSDGKETFRLHRKLIKGELYSGNILFHEILDRNKNYLHDRPEKEREILKSFNNGLFNFNHLHSPLYKRISKGLVNTHFDFEMHGAPKQRLFAKLNCWERFKLIFISRSSIRYKNPVEFYSLLLAVSGMLLSLIITTWNGYQTKVESIQRGKENQKLIEVIQKKDTQIENLIENTVKIDSITISHPKHK